jgi:hypothetical protein
VEGGDGVRGEGEMGRAGEGERPRPADGDDYTWGEKLAGYDLRTGPERLHGQVDDLAGRVRRMETQLSQEIRAITERLQQIEYIIEQYTGDHR